ncbi:MAG: hypothetical protein ABH883_00600 [Candidatus Omnitrophota bacterium]
MFKINRFLKTILGAVFICALCFRGDHASAILDTEKPWLGEKAEWMPEVSVSTSFMTKYIWRGWNLGDEPVMQTDASVSKWGLTLDVWTNYSLNDEKDRDGGRYQEFTEIDYTIDYTFNVGEMSEKFGMESPEIFKPLGLSAGYIYYTFPNVDWDDKYFDSHEVYFGCSYDILLQPSFTWYWDVDSGKGNSDGGGDGSYFLFGISHTFDLKESGISATFGVTTSIIDEQWTNKSGWGDTNFSCEVSIPLLNYFSITPSVNYSLIGDRDVYNDAAENEFYGGITVSFEY